MTLKVAVDAMGGDHAPGFVVEGAVRAVREGGCQVVLVGRQDALQAELWRLAAASLEGIEIAHACQVGEMGTESAAQGLRQKKDSSIRVAARLVKEGRASALVSAGHTGAVMAAAKILLGSIEGVDRLPIAVTAPAVGGKGVILGAGANADCKPHHFPQLPVTGYLYDRVVPGVNNPRVALLSSGVGCATGAGGTRD